MSKYQWEEAGKHNPWGKKRIRGTHCAKGHEYTEENTFIRQFDNARVCRQCRKEYARMKYQERKIQNNGVARPKKEKVIAFEIPESAQISEAALPFWIDLQNGLRETLTPCTNSPEIFADNSITVSIDKAEEMCYGCPLLKACYDYAVSDSITAGIWGGVIMDTDDGSLFQEEDYNGRMDS